MLLGLCGTILYQVSQHELFWGGISYAKQSDAACDVCMTVFRWTGQGLAAREQALALWMDAKVRESCGDALAPAPSFALNVFNHSPIGADKGSVPACDSPASPRPQSSMMFCWVVQGWGLTILTATT